MSTLTIPMPNTATNIASENIWPGHPISKIRSGITLPVAQTTSDFDWTEAPFDEALQNWQRWYKAEANTCGSIEVGTWIVHTEFTPPTDSHFQNRIMQAALPAKWILAGIHPPTAACRAKAIEVWTRLYRKFGLLPVRVSASVEGGITLCYEHAVSAKTLIIEIYNDLEVAVLVNHSKSIVYSENIAEFDFDQVFLQFNV